MPGQLSVLHVDDDPNVLDLSTQLFERTDSSIDTLTADSGEEGLERLREEEIDCLVSDSVRMPDGEAFIEAANRESDVPIVVFTAKEWEAVATDVIGAEAAEYVRKSRASDYRTVVRHVLSLTDEAGQSTEDDRQLIGKHEFATHTELGVDIVHAVANYTEREPTEFAPLYDAVDAEALEKLFAPSVDLPRAESIEVQFTYEGHDIAVNGDGRISVVTG